MKTFIPILRVMATIVCGPMLFLGVIWILQGVNLLPGSFMTGHIEWALWGIVLVLLGVVLVWWLNRRRI